MERLDRLVDAGLRRNLVIIGDGQAGPSAFDRYGLDGVFPVVKTEIGRLAAVASEEILYELGEDDDDEVIDDDTVLVEKMKNDEANDSLVPPQRKTSSVAAAVAIIAVVMKE